MWGGGVGRPPPEASPWGGEAGAAAGAAPERDCHPVRSPPSEHRRVLRLLPPAPWELRPSRIAVLVRPLSLLPLNSVDTQWVTAGQVWVGVGGIPDHRHHAAPVAASHVADDPAPNRLCDPLCRFFHHPPTTHGHRRVSLLARTCPLVAFASVRTCSAWTPSPTKRFAALPSGAASVGAVRLDRDGVYEQRQADGPHRAPLRPRVPRARGRARGLPETIPGEEWGLTGVPPCGVKKGPSLTHS